MLNSSDQVPSLSDLLGVTVALGSLIALPLAVSAVGVSLGPVSLAVLTALVFGLTLTGVKFRRRSMGKSPSPRRPPRPSEPEPSGYEPRAESIQPNHERLHPSRPRVVTTGTTTQ